MKKLLVAAAASLCMSAASAAAVYDTSGTGMGVSGNAGNQVWVEMLGNDFLVNVGGLQVTELGAFNADGNGISGNVTVGLYDLTAQAAVINPISFMGQTGSSTYLFQTLLAPVALIAGHSYSIQAFGFNSADWNFNTNATGGVNNASNAQSTTPITFNSLGGKLSNLDSRYGGTSMGNGTTWAHASTFGAGTLTVAVVPEPETYALMLAGLGALGFMGRRRKSAAKA